MRSAERPDGTGTEAAAGRRRGQPRHTSACHGGPPTTPGTHVDAMPGQPCDTGTSSGDAAAAPRAARRAATTSAAHMHACCAPRDSSSARARRGPPRQQRQAVAGVRPTTTPARRRSEHAGPRGSSARLSRACARLRPRLAGASEDGGTPRLLAAAASTHQTEPPPVTLQARAGRRARPVEVVRASTRAATHDVWPPCSRRIEIVGNRWGQRHDVRGEAPASSAERTRPSRPPQASPSLPHTGRCQTAAPPAARGAGRERRRQAAQSRPTGVPDQHANWPDLRSPPAQDHTECDRPGATTGWPSSTTLCGIHARGCRQHPATTRWT